MNFINKKFFIFIFLLSLLLNITFVNAQSTELTTSTYGTYETGSAGVQYLYDNNDTTGYYIAQNSYCEVFNFNSGQTVTNIYSNSQGAYDIRFRHTNGSSSTDYVYHVGSGVQNLTLNVTDVKKVIMVASTRFNIWSFKLSNTEPPPPSLLSISPSNGNASVPVNSQINATFDTDITSVDSVTLKKSTGEDVPLTTSISYSILKIIPTVTLDYDTSYNLSISGVTSTQGKKSNTTVISSFKTLKDTTPPVVANIIPPPGATDVSTFTNVKIQFSKKISGEGLDKVYIEGINSTKLVIDDTITMTLEKQLEYSTQYKLHIEGVKDLAGNVMQSPVEVNFTTERDSSPLRLVSYKPSGIYPVDTKFQFDFNKNIDLNTLSLVVKDDKGNNISFTKSAVGNKLIVYPALLQGKKYKLTLNSIKDLNGNLYDSPVEISIESLTSSGNADFDNVTTNNINALAWLKQNGIKLIVAAITFGIIFIVVRWLWKKTKYWLKKS